MEAQCSKNRKSAEKTFELFSLMISKRNFCSPLDALLATLLLSSDDLRYLWSQKFADTLEFASTLTIDLQLVTLRMRLLVTAVHMRILRITSQSLCYISKESYSHVNSDDILFIVYIVAVFRKYTVRSFSHRYDSMQSTIFV